jgi:hypothetical protein
MILAFGTELAAQLRQVRVQKPADSADGADGVGTVDVVDAFRPAMSCLQSNAPVLPTLVRCESKKSASTDTRRLFCIRALDAGLACRSS